jgi:hypothetical protein
VYQSGGNIHRQPIVVKNEIYGASVLCRESEFYTPGNYFYFMDSVKWSVFFI